MKNQLLRLAAAGVLACMLSSCNSEYNEYGHFTGCTCGGCERAALIDRYNETRLNFQASKTDTLTIKF